MKVKEFALFGVMLFLGVVWELDARSDLKNIGIRADCKNRTERGVEGVGVMKAQKYPVIMKTCSEPVSVAVSSVTEDGMTFFWIPPATLPKDGYEYEIRNSGAAGSGVDGLVLHGNLSFDESTYKIKGLSPLTSYMVYVRSNCSDGNFSIWTASDFFTTRSDYYEIANAKPATICSTGSLTLSASATGGSISWFEDETGGVALGTGEAFVTPVISTTKSYWVETVWLGDIFVGPISPMAHGGGIDTQKVGWDMFFSVLKNTKLVSVDIFPQISEQKGTVKVKDASGKVIHAYHFTTNGKGGVTAQTIFLNCALTPGDYSLEASVPVGGLTRNSSGSDYPYTSSIANITGNFYNEAYFMCFYNWRFEAQCTSPRVAVKATVTPELVLSTNDITICSGQSGSVVNMLSDTTDYDTYVWSPEIAVTGDVAKGWVFNPNETTAYTLTASQSKGDCSKSVTLGVNVNPLPVVPAGNTRQTLLVNTLEEATVANLMATGTAVVWYTTEADALANVNPLAAGTQLVSGNTYYAMPTVGGCRNLMPLTVTVILGAASFDMPGLKYYPNPVVDKFTVTYTNDITSVEVFNLVGQRVMAVQPNTTTAQVNMSVLPAGAYVVKVKASGQSQSIKVIKK